MKERGIIIPIGGGIHFRILPYWKCLWSHKWVYEGRWESRTCSRCNIHMTYELLNTGMEKAWVWRIPSVHGK